MSRSLNTGSAQQQDHGHRVRRRKLVDLRLQGQLLVALILLELGMLVVGVAYLYGQFGAVIDANLYSIHRSAQPPLLPTLLRQLGLVVVVMGAINTLALLIANQLWVGHIRRVTEAFRRRLQRVQTLDLRRPVARAGARHEVLELLEAWCDRESTRAAEIDALLAQLPTDAADGDPEHLSRLLEALDTRLQSVR